MSSPFGPRSPISRRGEGAVGRQGPRTGYVKQNLTRPTRPIEPRTDRFVAIRLGGFRARRSLANWAATTAGRCAGGDDGALLDSPWQLRSRPCTGHSRRTERRAIVPDRRIQRRDQGVHAIPSRERPLRRRLHSRNGARHRHRAGLAARGNLRGRAGSRGPRGGDLARGRDVEISCA